jgi:capsular polysaccharide biosynthesis protein
MEGVSAGGVPVKIADLDDWTVEAEIDTGLPTLKTRTACIAPSLTLHRDVVVTGLDWLPIKGGEVALLIHSPAHYFTKVGIRQALSRDGDAIRAHPGPVRELEGTSLLVGGVDHLYHWLVDYLPRLLMAKRVMPALPRILINRPGRIQIESLRRIGVHEWEEVGDDESVRCETLWIPSMLANTTIPHPAIVPMLRKALPPSSGLPRRSIYLSRRDAATRNLVNETELEAQLHGFETHLAAHLTLQQQIDLFASADRLVAVHGNGMTNQIFCRPGIQVFEIAVAEHRVTSMQCLALACGHTHRFVDAAVAVKAQSARELLGQWKVDLHSVRQAMSAS